MGTTKAPPPPPPPPPPTAPPNVQPQPRQRHPYLRQDASAREDAAARAPPSNDASHPIHRSRHQPHGQRAAVVPPPPPPPPATAAERAPQNQMIASAHNDRNANDNDAKHHIRTVTFHRSLAQHGHSQDSISSNASSSITSHFQDKECLLSPKLQSFFNIPNNGTNDQGGRTPSKVGTQKQDDVAALLFSPTQMDESNELSLLHSIFSPKFHAASAKKKKTRGQRPQPQYKSVFSPHPTTPGSLASDARQEGDDVSAMSDDFGTINAILRGDDAVETMKRQVGLDPERHPLSPTREEVIQNDVKENREDGRGANDDALLPTNDALDEGSTEVMLDKARLLAGGNGSPSEMQRPTARKTPRVSPSSDDEFYTPTSIAAPSTTTPTALSFDAGHTKSVRKSGLPPVLEDEEMKPNGVSSIEVSRSFEGMDAGEFRTPKQYGVVWKLDANSTFAYDDDVEDEFYSPLASHAVHTPSSKFNVSPEARSDSIFSLSVSKDELSVSQSDVPSSEVPAVMATSSKKESLPRGYAEVKEELQSLLKEAKGLSPPEKSQQAPRSAFASKEIKTPLQTTSTSLRYPQGVGSAPRSPMYHLHSPSVSSLPRDALTVDFVRQCECVDTLEAILCLLSDDNNNVNHRGGKSWGKQLRYPSLVRLVEKRLQKLRKDESRQLTEEEWPIQVRNTSPRYQSAEAMDKENVDPVPQQQELPSVEEAVSERLHEPSRPMESITVLHDSNDGGEENERSTNKQAVYPHPKESPSSAEHSSLDMNLSESRSLFTLDDESYYWKQGMDVVDEGGEREQGECQPNLNREENAATGNNQHMASQTEAGYGDLKASNVHLTGEVDSLIKELNDATAKHQSVADELSRLKAASAANQDAQQKQIDELEAANFELGEEVRELQMQLELRDQKAKDTASQLQRELEETRMQNSDLSQEKERLKQKLNDLRCIHESAQKEVAKLKLLVKRNASSESAGAEQLKRVVESAQLANKALANALAVSEKDLADANESKEESVRECMALRARASELEDKTAFLSSKMKEMNKELKSSHAYIDRLFADLQAQSSRSPSKEMKADFERRELEWMELERRYSNKIKQLEEQLVFDSKNRRVSLDAYMQVVQQTRHYKSESAKKEQVIGELKSSVSELRDKLDRVERSAMKKNRGGGKSLQSMKAPSHDENAAPSTNPGRPPSSQEGKMGRVAAIKAAGGRRGLSEQLRRARRF